MRVLAARNVNDAWVRCFQAIQTEGVFENTRNGEVLVFDTPVTTVYSRPIERVLFCQSRRANPFFHLFEAMWMLAGRRDAAFLDQYVHDFGARYAEFDGNIWGAYGFRWRHWFNQDQLAAVVQKLRSDPSSRQVVLQMWDGGVDLVAEVRDRPCNLAVMFRIRQEHQAGSPATTEFRYVLDITVACRSNDIIWGAYGANAVHFSILHEFIADQVEVGMGRYYQISNNLHVYTKEMEKIKGRGKVETCDLYASRSAMPTVLFKDRTYGVLEEIEEWTNNPTAEPKSSNSDLVRNILIPMARAHSERKNKYSALSHLEKLPGNSDWRLAAETWLERVKRS